MTNDVPEVIKQLVDDGRWGAVFFALSDSGNFLEDAGNLNHELALRVECYVVYQEQYVYTERLTADAPWSEPKLGEHLAEDYPADMVVDTMEMIVESIPADIPVNQIHPLLRPLL